MTAPSPSRLPGAARLGKKQTMHVEHLTRQKCRECGKTIMVAEYSPHPLEAKATGMSASVWDDDREIFVGWICNDCAFDRAMTVGGGGMVGGCGASMSFSYMPKD